MAVDDDASFVDIRFTHEGISVSHYEDGGATVANEVWFTWAEVEDLKSDNESHITFDV